MTTPGAWQDAGLPDLTHTGETMNIHIARNGERSIRLTQSEIQHIQRASQLVMELERIGLALPDPQTLSKGLALLLEMPVCKPPVTIKEPAGDSGS